MLETTKLSVLSYRLRQKTVEMIMAGKGGHIGGDMSVMDILVALYFHEMKVTPQNQADRSRDRFVLSKGHSVEAYYTVLAQKGFFPMQEVLEQYVKFGSPFIGHPNNHLPGIEMNSGSLGHGLPVCVGMALAGKREELPYRVYTVMGDGELAEGSIWEAAMAASHYRLDNLCAVVDRNHLQISGSTEEVMHQEDLRARWSAFGWNVVSVNGNDMGQLLYAFARARACVNQPTLVIANTVKGCGSPVMENKASWHHKVPTQEEYTQIMRDLKAREEMLSCE